MSSKRTTAETKQKFSQQIQHKIKDMMRGRTLLENARAEYYKLVNGTEYGPSNTGFEHFLRANYGVELVYDKDRFMKPYAYNVVDEKKHTLFLLKFGTE